MCVFLFYWYIRWDQINKDFYSTKNNKYDLTKVPDVYDMLRYDLLHNAHLNLAGLEELYTLAKNFENCVVPQEYGTDPQEKRSIGSKMCSALLEKINADLNTALLSCSPGSNDDLYQLDESHADDLRINTLGRAVRTRLYFTSESHMHTLLNVLRYAGPGDTPIICPEGLAIMDEISEISYLSQIVIRLFQDRHNPSIFHCELSFSPGAVNNPITDKTNSVAPYALLDKGIQCGLLIDHLEGAIKLSHHPPAVEGVTVNTDAVDETAAWELDDEDEDSDSKKKSKKDKKKDKKDKKSKD
jgi:hypothetical protein